MTQMFDMTGRVALLSGAGRGIGAASALALAEAGADVVVLARSAEQIDEVAAAARDLGRRALAIPTDATEPEAVAAAVARTVDEFGRLDTVVNVVGGYVPKPFLATSDDDLRDSFDLNVVYGLGLVRACVPHLAESDGASVVMISSAIGHVTGRGWVAYGTAKAALEHAVRLMARDLNPHIRVNAVAPGAIMTDALAGFADDSDLIEGLRSATPLRRIGSAEEVAAAVLYLAAPSGAFTTGHILPVDGGLQVTNMEMPFPDL
jgi:7-alpha-hydroxysteroid dehydrogenase